MTLLTNLTQRRRDYASAVLDTHPAAYWRGVVGGVAEDYSGHGVDGTASGTIGETDGPINRGDRPGMAFDGATGQIVSPGCGASVDLWSTVCWARGGPTAAQRVLMMHGNNKYGYALGVYSGDRVALYVYNNFNVNIRHQWIGGATMLLDGEWHQIGLTYSGGMFRFLFDGQGVVDTYSRLPLDDIGDRESAGSTGGGRYWHGDLAEVRFYDRAEDVDEFTGLYLQGRNGVF